MEEAEPPECPVCLQPYDAVSYIPRVLNCGHTTCQTCLNQLPNPFPNTIRCTVCTLLVKFPNHSPSALPKNLDLLHFSATLQRRQLLDEGTRSRSPPENGNDQMGLYPWTLKSWSYEFYCKWRRWVLPKDCIFIEETVLEDGCGEGHGKVFRCFENDCVVGCVLREKGEVCLVKVGVFVEDEGDSMVFRSSYELRVLSVLCGMKEEERDELGIVLRAALGVPRVVRACGFWYNESNHCVYMVREKFGWPGLVKCVLENKVDEEERCSSDKMRVLGMFGIETCEIVSRLHIEGLVIGCLDVSCFCFDEFGRVHFDLIQILNAGRRVNMAVQKGFKDLGDSLKNILLDNNLVFISPEVLPQLLIREGLELDLGNFRYEVGCASDVWSLACLLIWLIVGSPIVDEMKAFIHSVVNAIVDEKGCDYSTLYVSLIHKIVALLGSRLGKECVSLQEILGRCLEIDPGNRPLITEVWKCLRELVIKPQFDMGLNLKEEVKMENSGHCIVLGKLCQIGEEPDKELRDGDLGKDYEIGRAGGELRVVGDIVDGVSRGHIKCDEMKGHLDCISGLAIGGGFLFSSSYDKILNVWSLQDFTHVHSFKGHEHRVMAVVFVDNEQPLCISGDNQGVICIWKASFPFSEVPVEKLYEKKDWRYSGIHAMAVFGTEYLYTGSGDKLVKAWSLQDYSLSCEMSGHKSVVSSLVVCNGVLYSGSWDGTVRLWSLSDHSPLTVLGEDRLGNLVSVLSLSAEQNTLFVGHENGNIKMWHNDVLLKSIQNHKGAVFSVSKKGKWLFSGGWDKTVSVQEISEDVDGVDVARFGSFDCNSTITAIEYWQGKLFVGQADRIIKVYHGVLSGGKKKKKEAAAA